MTYREFIDGIIKERGQWNIPSGEYFEVHHIVPRCLGGDGEIRKGRNPNKHPNLIFLYAREHFIAHKLLALENPTNSSLVFAWSMMAFPKGKTRRNFEITPEEYEELKSLMARNLKETSYFSNNPPWNKGRRRVYSEDTLEKMRKPRLSSRGRRLSEETKEKMSASWHLRSLENYGKNRGKICITNGTVNRYIDKNDEIPDGFYLGGAKIEDTSNRKRAWTPERRLAYSERNRGANNPNYGNGEKMAGGNNSTAIYIYVFEGNEYLCRKDLLTELKKRWNDISPSAIRRIMSGKYTDRIRKKFNYIIENLSWRLKDENKVSKIGNS